MTNKQAVFGVVKFEVHDENVWTDGRVYSTITIGDMIYACSEDGMPCYAFEVAEIIHYSRNLPQIERGQVVRLVLKGNPDDYEILKPFGELFSLTESS